MLDRISVFVMWQRRKPYWRCVTAVHLRAEEIVRFKYGAELAPSTPAEIDTQQIGLLEREKLLADFYHNVSGLLDQKRVHTLSALSKTDKCKLVCWAAAFDLMDYEYREFKRSLNENDLNFSLQLRQSWCEAGQTDDNRWKFAPYGELTDSERRLRFKSLHNKIDLSEAYQLGTDMLRADLSFGGPEHSIYYLIPYGVLRSRSAYSGLQPNWSEPPVFAALTEREKAIATYLHKAISCHANEAGELELMEEVSPIQFEKLLSLSELTALLGRPLKILFESSQRRDQLPIGDAKDVDSARVSASAFDVVQYVFEGWPQSSDMRG